MPDRPNVVLICVDQWRGDCLSIDGHPIVRTPFLDGLALQGTRFSRAYSAVPTCIPARAALFTGLGQRSHGRVGYQDGVPWDYPVTLAGEFTRHGYQTQAVGKMHVYPERSQLGFQNVVLHDGYLRHVRRTQRALDLVDDYLPWLRRELGRDADYYDHGVDCNSPVARPWDKEEYLHPTNYVSAQSIDFLRRRDPRKPFFLYVSFHRPHPPYDPPGWAFDQYVQQSMPEPPVGDWTDLFAANSSPYLTALKVGPVASDVLQRARAGYYGHMSHIDHQINRFLEALGNSGVLEDTFICFTSDHGEMLGDHHLFSKMLPYEGSAHVPLILVGPAASGIRAAGVCDQVTELRDIMPTLLDCAGLPVPEGVEGQSLLPLARGEEGTWRTHLHGEHTLRIGDGDRQQSIQWLTNGREKYVWLSGPGHEQLFDLRDDPTECHDLSRLPASGQRLRQWRDLLVRELSGRPEGFVAGRELVPGRPVLHNLPSAGTP